MFRGRAVLKQDLNEQIGYSRFVLMSGQKYALRVFKLGLFDLLGYYAVK
jgi:hypothetical protein